MQDDIGRYGLGALPDVPDDRDYPVEALYAAEGLIASVVLPGSYVVPGMPPVLDQGSTPMCVAFSTSGMKAWQDKRDQEVFFNFDEPLFFKNIGGTSAGAYVKTAMEEMRVDGYPVAGSGDPGHHKIAAYYVVPRTYDDLRSAIFDLGPIVISTPWYRSWFHPNAQGVLPAPDTQVGGHAIVAYGWDARGIRLRNSWGADWGISGDCWMPAYLVPHVNGAWKAVDAIEHPIPYAHVADVLARPSLNVRAAPNTAARKVASLPYGRDVSTTRLEKYGGKYTANGHARTDWLEVKYSGTRTGWIARGFTRIIR